MQEAVAHRWVGGVRGRRDARRPPLNHTHQIQQRLVSAVTSSQWSCVGAASTLMRQKLEALEILARRDGIRRLPERRRSP